MFRKFFTYTVEQVLLGRWRRTCAVGSAIKADWANTDHCGTCSYHPTKSTLAAMNDTPPDRQSPSYTGHIPQKPEKNQ